MTLTAGPSQNLLWDFGIPQYPTPAYPHTHATSREAVTLSDDEQNALRLHGISRNTVNTPGPFGPFKCIWMILTPSFSSYKAPSSFLVLWW